MFLPLVFIKTINFQERQTDDRPALVRVVRSATYMAGLCFLRDIGNRQIKLKEWFICELRPLSIISVKLTTSTKCTEMHYKIRTQLVTK